MIRVEKNTRAYRAEYNASEERTCSGQRRVRPGKMDLRLYCRSKTIPGHIEHYNASEGRRCSGHRPVRPPWKLSHRHEPLNIKTLERIKRISFHFKLLRTNLLASSHWRRRSMLIQYSRRFRVPGIRMFGHLIVVASLV